jgi:hypothetical protein
MRVVRRGLLFFAVPCALVAASPAAASKLIDENATGITLAVNAKGEALVTYSAKGRQKRVLLWGAVDARPPSRGQKQVEFSIDYSGGYGKYRTTYWKTFGSACGAYDGPPLAWLVAACKAPDGSYWALQAWQRGLPNYGVPAAGTRAAWELRVSHWTGDLPALELTVFRADHGRDHLFGTYALDGGGVYGFRSTPAGVPLDTYGRNVYVDTFNSTYGAGWKRENSFLTHGPGGTFCYSFSPHGGRPSGNGAKYRATVIGPGVTPDVMWTGTAPASVGAAARGRANAAIRALRDPSCKPA